MNSTAPSMASTTKHTDLQSLKDMSGGSDEFVIEMIEMFLEDTPPSLEVMKKSLAEKDYETLRSHAHKIKPSISFMGIKELEQTMPDLEQYCDTRTNLEEVPAMVEKVDKICQEAFDELKEELEKLK